MRRFKRNCSFPSLSSLGLSGRQNEATTEETLTDLPLLNKIQNQDWNSLLSELTTANLTKVNEILRGSAGYEGASIMHELLRHNPPLSIVSEVSSILTDVISSKDNAGRTPLHVAIEHRASKLIIGHLAKNHPQACSTKDQDGNTPLHKFVEGIPGPELDAWTEDVADILVYASPESLDVEDDSEMCPLEMAIMLGAPIQIVALLQRVKRVYRRLGSAEKSLDEGNFVDIATRIAEDHDCCTTKRRRKSSKSSDEKRRKSSVSSAA